MPSHAVIYYTHLVNDTIKAEVRRLQSEINDNYNLFIMGCGANPAFLDALSGPEIQTRPYTRDDLRELPYVEQLSKVDWKTLRRNPDLALMKFFRETSNFDFYWIIEYDVRYTGCWRTLLEDLEGSSADILCSHLTYFEQSPDWIHWESFSSGAEQVGDDKKIRGFLVFCRLSNKLMKAIDERCKAGWTGHPEVLWPTIAACGEMSLEEIGGGGMVVPPSRKDKFYASSMSRSGIFLSTLAAWPIYSEKSNFIGNSPPNILWHPVKD